MFIGIVVTEKWPISWKIFPSRQGTAGFGAAVFGALGLLSVFSGVSRSVPAIESLAAWHARAGLQALTWEHFLDSMQWLLHAATLSQEGDFSCAEEVAIGQVLLVLSFLLCAATRNQNRKVSGVVSDRPKQR